jgi:hypothetical protein
MKLALVKYLHNILFFFKNKERVVYENIKKLTVREKIDNKKLIFSVLLEGRPMFKKNSSRRNAHP